MKSSPLLLLIAALLLSPATASAAQFAVFGPRALGMGGASVAAVNDSTAVYWNPAALADFRKVDIRLAGGAAVRDYMDLSDKWDRINAIYDDIAAGNLSAAGELKQLLLDLDRTDAVTNIDVTGGLLLSIPLSGSAVAVSVLGVGYAELFPTIDTYHFNTSATLPLPADSIAQNNSAVTAMGIVMAEPAVSFATTLGESVLVGVNAKMISASTFLHSDYIRTGDYSTFIDNMNNSETRSSKASFDAGVLVKPIEGLTVGLVGKYLNSPSFPVDGKVAVRSGSGDVAVSSLPVAGELELKPQYRAGVAWKPFDSLTLSADYDLTKNKSFTERTEDRTVAAGAELTLLDEILSLRAGAYTNTANSEANFVYTAGLGFRIFMLRIDLAGAYDFHKQEAQASAGLALRF